jgi:hypothetical protein
VRARWAPRSVALRAYLADLHDLHARLLHGVGDYRTPRKSGVGSGNRIRRRRCSLPARPDPAASGWIAELLIQLAPPAASATLGAGVRGELCSVRQRRSTDRSAPPHLN